MFARFASIVLLLSNGLMGQSVSATYLGIADCDDAAIGRNGDVYLSCHSPADRLPIEAKPSKVSRDEMDAYVLRINAQSGKIIYAVRIAGSEYDNAIRIGVDGKGFAYAAGFTKSRDFPTTADALQPRFGGGDSDAFLVKISPEGKLVYSTFIGGSGTDQGNGLVVDAKGKVFVAGTTWSNDFPSARPVPRDGRGDVFVSCFQPGTRVPMRAIVFGGREEEKLTGIALDEKGGLFAAGYTKSRDFPVAGPVQSELRGATDLFLTRLSAENLELTFSTFFGGSGDDSGWAVAVGPGGDPVVAGITDSADLPVSSDAFQRTRKGGKDAFVAKFRGPDFRQVQASYFGGSKDDESGYDGGSMKVDQRGNVWLAGITGSSDLPGVTAQYHGGETDGFVAVFSPDLSKLCYSSVHGGSDRDLLEGVALSKGRAVAVGLSFSSDLQLTGTVIQRHDPSIQVAGKGVNVMLIGLPRDISCR